MFDSFEKKPLFEDQIHERQHFKLNIQGSDYAGIYHDDEIHWFHPHPKNTFEDEHIEAIEAKVHETMRNEIN